MTKWRGDPTETTDLVVAEVAPAKTIDSGAQTTSQLSDVDRARKLGTVIVLARLDIVKLVEKKVTTLGIKDAKTITPDYMVEKKKLSMTVMTM